MWRHASWQSPLSLLSAVFDTAILTEGHLYQLDQHLQRFLTNAARANIPLPPGLSAEQMRRTILETAAASCKLNGQWGGAGRGEAGRGRKLGSSFCMVA